MADATYQPKTYRKSGGDEHVIAAGGTLNMEAGSKHIQPVVLKAADYTVTAAESGTTFIATAENVVFTLPSTVAGLWYRFITHTVTAGTGTSISPAAADAIHGGGQASTDDKDLINSGATDAEGDCVTIIGDGVDGWWITEVVGTWAEE